MSAPDPSVPSTPVSYNIRDTDGIALAVGMSEAEARRIAQRVANTLGESVWLRKVGSDGAEEVHPEIVSPKERRPVI
jgi:hypothetical protein